MSLKGSCIPHLARAIAEKKKLRASHVIDSLRIANKYNGGAHVQNRCTSTGTVRSFSAAGRSSIAARPPARPSRFAELREKNFRKQQEQEEKEKAAAQHKKDLRFRKYLYGALTFAAGTGIYILYTYQSYKLNIIKYNKSDRKLEQNENVMDRWHDRTRNFDDEVEYQEKLMLMWWKRRRLVREAYGDVLEVSVGTGRNMMLYDTRPYDPTESASFGRDKRHMITSLTFNDQSPVMIEQAQKKWKIEQKKMREGDRFLGNVSWITGDAGVTGIIPRPRGGYDTIIQTMGVCSMPRPVEFLRRLGRLARQPGEEVVNASPQRQREQMDDGKGGRIFLLEHGRARDTWPWSVVNKILDSSAPMHADRYGCWFNKDIGDVIEQSGLVVERVRRYHFGTTWEIVLRPAPVPMSEEETKVSVTAAPAIMASQGSSKSWLSSLWG